MIEVSSPPAGAALSRARTKTAVLVLADGTVFEGIGFGAAARGVGEVCFNTAMTGYQEILTDPSYAGQVVAFTFPHIGIVGTNIEDIEALTPVVRGVVVRADAANPVEVPRADGPRPLAHFAQYPRGSRGSTPALSDRAYPRERHAAWCCGPCARRRLQPWMA